MISEKEFNRLFATNLKRYMEFYGYKQIDISRILNVSSSTVSSWITEQRTPRMDKVDALCRLFKCKRSDLIAEEFNAPAIGEEELLSMYRSLNAEGKAKARELVSMLVSTGQYKKHGVDDMVQKA